MKRSFALLLAAVTLLCCACASEAPNETTAPETEQVTLPEAITVTFQPNNGDPTVVVEVEEGALATGAPTPTKRACNFAGWFCGEKQWDLAKDTVTESVTLTAHWTLAENAFERDPNAGKKAEGTQLRVCSFNTLLPTVGANIPVNPGRDAGLASMVKAYLPDVIAFQEFGMDWYNAFCDVLGDTDYVTITGKVYNLVGDTGQNTIAYRSSVLTMLDCGYHDYFVGRRFEWALFETKDEAKQQFIVITTHWQPKEDDQPRVYQAKELAQRIRKLQEKYPVPVIAMGDFNTRDSYGSYQTLLQESDLLDAKYEAPVRGLVCETTHSSLKTKSFKDEKVNTAECIDHIFYTPGLEALYYDTIIDEETIATSDHVPVYADLKFASQS